MGNAEPRRPPRVHFSGIGGLGMVAGAHLAVEIGCDVRGSDGPLYPPASEMVADLGVRVYEGYKGSNLNWKPDVVVVGNTLSRGNPEVEAVLERGLRYVSLPEWLKENVLRARRPVAVCGTHGKTTTTALLAHILQAGDMRSGFLIGGRPVGFAHSSSAGRPGGFFAIEGDEYDSAFFDKRAKFLHYLPQIAVVTSIDFDHGDIYKDVGEIEVAFERMLRQVPESGWLVACADHPRALALREKAPCRVLTYGFDGEADVSIVQHVQEAGRQTFGLTLRGKPFGEFVTLLPGRYNVQNIAAACAVAHLCDVPVGRIVGAVASFAGVHRRMEVFHEARGAVFVDDFAHHPVAIAGAIEAARNHWPGRRLTVLFEPRTNTTTTKRFEPELCDALCAADRVLIGPVYRPERIEESLRLDPERLAGALRDGGTEARHVGDVGELVGLVAGELRDGDLVLILSNGAFGGIYSAIRERIAEVG